MSGFLGLVIVLAAMTIPAVGWRGPQLLWQNGRILLRLNEPEQRLQGFKFDDDPEPEAKPLGGEAPACELPDLAGERKSLAQFRGHAVLLVFFNPVYGLSHGLMPKLAASLPEGQALRVPKCRRAQ